MSRYTKHYIPPEVPKIQNDFFSITFLGNTNLLISDGTTNILTDGYFSRPGISSIIFGAEPDTKTIDDILKAHSISKLDYVIPLHSHFDHAMDSPYVAEQTGAVLIGDQNVRQINTGWQKSQIRENRYALFEDKPVVAPLINVSEVQFHTQCSRTNTLCAGDLEITFFSGEHYDNIFDKSGSISNPLLPPASIFDYTRSDSNILLISSPQGKVLIVGSAGPLKSDFLESDVLDNIDIVFIATPGLTKLSDKDLKVMQDIIFSAKIIIPLHWDDFFKYDSDTSGKYELKPPMWIVDKFAEIRKSIDFLCAKSKDFDRQFGLMTFGVSYSINQLKAYKAPVCSPD